MSFCNIFDKTQCANIKFAQSIKNKNKNDASVRNKKLYDRADILINTPDLNNKGGVATLYATLRPFFNKEIDYFYTGNRGAGAPFFNDIHRILSDYASFIIRLIKGRYSTIIINPSLANKALIRDGIFVLLSLLFNRKIIVFFHGWKDETEQRITSKWKQLFCLVFFRVNSFIVLAEKYKNKIESWGYKGDIIIGTTCVENDFFTRHRQIAKQNTNTKKSDFTILFLSRIEKDKGVYEAIDIYKKIKTRNNKTKMIIAGSGNALPGVKRFVQDKNLRDIEFKGFVEGPQKMKVFDDADCYLFTSYSEGMPVSVLEAMTAGLPVVTTPVGGLVDFFEQGRMGYMIPLKKTDRMVDRLEELIQKKNQAIRIGEYNKKYAQQHFSASCLSKLFYRLIQNLK